jgi:hypothetical protein
MGDNDAAFLWESEALRSSTSQPAPSATGYNGKTTESGWVTLREASEIADIPIKTLRKWARRDYIDSYLEETSDQPIRMVLLASVHKRAYETGRRETQETDSVEAQPRREPARTLRTPPAESPPEPEPPPPGTMLVPIDAWNKMLNQLGNLHQAGQELAEARERAAKAETESLFLKERLSEMRSELSEGRAVTASPASVEDESLPDAGFDIVGEIEDEIEADEIEDNEIFVKGRGRQDDGVSATAYSLEMMKHFYSTWRSRPRR